MKDFVSFDLVSDLDPPSIFERAKGALPDFNWRMGDSESQGPYITGTNSDLVQVKLWLGEKPIAGSVSFNGAMVNAQDRERRKEDLFKQIEGTFLSSIGTMLTLCSGS